MRPPSEAPEVLGCRWYGRPVNGSLRRSGVRCHQRCPWWAAPLGNVTSPEPPIVTWQGRQLRVRHDDPHLGPYTPRGAVIRAAVELASVRRNVAKGGGRSL